MSNSQKDDVEAGSPLLYPSMKERPELRWAFIRKVYSILALQLLATIAVAAVVVNVHPIALFFSTTWTGFGVYLAIIFIPIIVMFPLYYYHQKHPLNFILLGVFTVAFGFAVGIVCAFTSGKAILETVIVTSVAIMSLTIYTFWAAKRGRDFAFLVPFFLSLVIVLLLFTIFQIFFPGKLSEIIVGCIASLIFCAYIIYDTYTLIERNTYDEYIWASVSLYLDVLNIFLQILSVVTAAER